MAQDSLNTRSSLKVGSHSYTYYSIPKAAAALGVSFDRLPYSLKVVLENLLRFEDNRTVTVNDIKAIASWVSTKTSEHEIAYRPARVLMQDFTGVPAVVDLAAMRDAMQSLGGDPKQINPLSPVDLVIDHSVMVDNYGTHGAFDLNVKREMERNVERYEFLRWGQQAFDNFRVVPPGTGICHQVNLEYLAQVVWTKTENGETTAYPDTLVGTDSHTTMVNGLAVLGWGVGGIEAEAAMLGQPISMILPEVVGFRLTGTMKEGLTATDLVLTITQMLRKRGVVGKFVEFFGPGLDHLSLADRATIANMAPEYGATCGFFPVDAETLNYMRLSGRSEDRIALTEAYAKAQGMWRTDAEPVFTDTLELDLSSVEPSIAGPKRPQDRVTLSKAKESFANAFAEMNTANTPEDAEANVAGQSYSLHHGDVMIAAITSCTNTSNPSVMIAAGILAQKARAKGLTVKPWVKTSLAPGSKVVTEYYARSGLDKELDAMGFNLVGYGCTTCIGNSGPLKAEIEAAIKDNNLVTTSVLSGNRNFEGRVHPLTKANYLMSPPLVVAYALLGTFKKDIYTDALGTGSDGKPVYLKDIWPSNAEINAVMAKCITREMFESRYKDVFSGDAEWQAIKVTPSLTYAWDATSTYIKNPPYFNGMRSEPEQAPSLKSARILALLGDSITTDHISPAGNIAKDGPAATYLKDRGVPPVDFNSYGARRGHDEVMVRGTFANIRLKNEMAPGTEGGVTRHMPEGSPMSIFDAAMQYQQEKTPLVVIAGKEYGTGSSRDWAAKGTRLLGVSAVIAESFERIHRSNLVGMGILPFTFPEGVTRQTLKLDGSETIDLPLPAQLSPRMQIPCTITRSDGSKETVTLLCRLDTLDEVEYYLQGGILHYTIRKLMREAKSRAA